MKKLALATTLGAACLALAACGDTGVDNAAENNVAATGEAGVAAGTDGNGTATAAAGSWTKDARIVEEDGATWRIEADGTRVRLADDESRIVVENGVRYRVDPGGVRVRIDDKGIDLTPDIDLPDIDLPDVDAGINKKGNPDIDVKDKKDGNDGPN